MGGAGGRYASRADPARSLVGAIKSEIFFFRTHFCRDSLLDSTACKGRLTSTQRFFEIASHDLTRRPAPPTQDSASTLSKIRSGDMRGTMSGTKENGSTRPDELQAANSHAA